MEHANNVKGVGDKPHSSVVRIWNAYGLQPHRTKTFKLSKESDGTMIGTCYPLHRNEEFLKFLRKIDRKTPRGHFLHLILGNYGTHNHPNVKSWLKHHPRFHLHFTPTSSSWLNLVERWFGEITRKRIRRGIFKSVPEFIAAIKVVHSFK